MLTVETKYLNADNPKCTDALIPISVFFSLACQFWFWLILILFLSKNYKWQHMQKKNCNFSLMENSHISKYTRLQYKSFFFIFFFIQADKRSPSLTSFYDIFCAVWYDWLKRKKKSPITVSGVKNSGMNKIIKSGKGRRDHN